MSDELAFKNLGIQNQQIYDIISKYGHIELLKRGVSGTYKNSTTFGAVVELRVDVDGRRPQNRVSGDVFFYVLWTFGLMKTYQYSFVVESLTSTISSTEVVLTGPVKYYNDPTKVSDTIEVRIPRVYIFSPAANAVVKFYTSGTLNSTYTCPKISEYFRKVTLEIDMMQGTAFPPTANTCTDPHPADLTCEDMTLQKAYQRAGIDMTVIEDDVLTDSDSSDAGTDWDWAELHDLMEDEFNSFSNSLQWNVYGVVVPWFEDHGVYGIMFDWAGGQPGDTYFRQGAAMAHTATLGRVSGTLYNTAAKQDRLLLWTFAHEIGHAFNLPHTWLRHLNADAGSESFMNYPWGYSGGESGFWSNFRWEFDDVELTWMRHADRNSVIFGGINWIWNNLSSHTEPQIETTDNSLKLEVRGSDIYDYAQPVQIELKLQNASTISQTVLSLLEPEDAWMTIYITRPDGQVIRYYPPMTRSKDPAMATLAPNEALYQSVMLSFSAKGAVFEQPGEYKIRAYFNMANKNLVVSPAYRLRIATPKTQSTEELAHLMFSHEAAKFIYFGGSERYPETTKRLVEATEKFKDTDPNTVAYIHAALGRNQSRPFKKLQRKGEKRVVTARKANLEQAIMHLEAARKLPASGVSALDNATYNKLSQLLSNIYVQKRQSKESLRVMQENLQYLQKRQVTKPVLQETEKRIAELKRTIK